MGVWGDLSFVQRVIDRLGVPYRAEELFGGDRSFRLDPDRTEARVRVLAHLYGMGFSLAEVSEICGISSERIRQILLKHGYQLRPVPGSNRWRRDRLSLLEREVGEVGRS